MRSSVTTVGTRASYCVASGEIVWKLQKKEGNSG